LPAQRKARILSRESLLYPESFGARCNRRLAPRRDRPKWSEAGFSGNAFIPFVTLTLRSIRLVVSLGHGGFPLILELARHG
jgi:hypothetical protein